MQARAVVDGILAYGEELVVLGLPDATCSCHAEAAGLAVAHEAFADRAYRPTAPWSRAHKPAPCCTTPAPSRRVVVRMANRRGVTAADDTVIQVEVQSVCVHGDTPGAVVAIAQQVQRRSSPPA